jgi:hypothetical protein
VSEIRPRNLADLLGEASSLQTFENMKKLCNQAEFEVPEGSGIKYKRRMLKPKDIVKLGKLQNQLTDDIDPEKRMDIVKEQAFICLQQPDGKDFNALWEETDASYMEIVVGACILISKGFRQV